MESKGMKDDMSDGLRRRIINKYKVYIFQARVGAGEGAPEVSRVVQQTPANEGRTSAMVYCEAPLPVQRC